MSYFFAELFGLSFIARIGITDTLDETGCVASHVVLQIQLSACLLLFFALPLFWFLAWILSLHQLYNMRGNRHLLSYRSIALLDDLEAQEMAGRLGLSP